MKQLEEQIGKSSSYSTILDKTLVLFCSYFFFSNTTLTKQAIKVNKRDHIKLKSTYKANETINKVKRQSKKMGDHA